MHYRVTASLDRLDEEQCSIVIEQIESAFRKAHVRGKIFISIDKDHGAGQEDDPPPLSLEGAIGFTDLTKGH